MADYIFVTRAGTELSINAVKVALAGARKKTIEDIINLTRVRAVNAAAPPTTVSNGFAALIGASPTGAFMGRAGHLAISFSYGWLFVSPGAIGNVAQDYRAAQYSYNSGTTSWTEMITDSTAEALGPIGEAGPVGASGVVTKLSTSATYSANGRVIVPPGDWAETTTTELAVDDGEPRTLVAATVRIGYPVVHIIPTTGNAYYTVLRPWAGRPTNVESERINSNQESGNLRVGTLSVDNTLATNRAIGTPIPQGALVRFVGMCTETKEITTDVARTDQNTFRFSRGCIMRESLLYREQVNTNINAQSGTGPTYTGVYMLFYRPVSGREATGAASNTWYFGSLSSSVNGSPNSQGGVFAVTAIPINTGVRVTVSSQNGTGGTNYIPFFEEEMYHVMPESIT